MPSKTAEPLWLDLHQQHLQRQSAVARGEAGALALTIAEVERASNDFLGADLRNAKLDGVRLEGILWDAATLWPEQWATRICRASCVSDDAQGVLVVTAEGSPTAIHAEA